MTLIKDIWCVGHLEGSGSKPVLNSLIYIMIHAIPYSMYVFLCIQLHVPSHIHLHHPLVILSVDRIYVYQSVF